jgi:hypothetical protein
MIPFSGMSTSFGEFNAGDKTFNPLRIVQSISISTSARSTSTSAKPPEA